MKEGEGKKGEIKQAAEEKKKIPDYYTEYKRQLLVVGVRGSLGESWS